MSKNCSVEVILLKWSDMSTTIFTFLNRPSFQVVSSAGGLLLSMQGMIDAAMPGACGHLFGVDNETMAENLGSRSVLARSWHLPEISKMVVVIKWDQENCTFKLHSKGEKSTEGGRSARHSNS